MRRIILAALCAAFSFCASSTPKVEPPRILDAGLCWYETERCRDIQYGARTITACKTEWEARCREMELERLNREGCQLVRLSDPKKIAVACGGAR